jgi:hypothetical protein
MPTSTATVASADLITSAPAADERSTQPFGSVGGMIAAEIWHWWIGVVLAVVGVLVVVGVIGGYLKSVTAQRYPGRRNRDD